MDEDELGINEIVFYAESAKITLKADSYAFDQSIEEMVDHYEFYLDGHRVANIKARWGTLQHMNIKKAVALWENSRK